VGGVLDPVPHRTIVGREAELEAIEAAFAAGTRLVTLTGLGGIGKTTIAAAIADRGIGIGQGPILFVDLSPIVRVDDVLPAIAAVLGVTGSDPDRLETAVVATLRRRPTVLVLDNVEGVAEAREIVGKLLEGTDQLQILATSRIPLAITDERRIPVAPLDLPSSADDIDRTGAGRLFLQRARERGGLRLVTADDAASIAGICRRMDGVPLALELAAAWTGLLSPRAILRRLEGERLTLAGTRGGRHDTMARVVETTLDLLEPDDRLSFEALSIFVAPFDELDARAMIDRDDVLPVLRRLEASALVQPQVERDGEPRFRILETVRAVGSARLARRDDADAIESRFVAQAARRAQGAADALRDVDSSDALAWMTAELPNLQAASALAVRRGDAESAVQLAMTLATHGVRAGNARQCLAALRVALAMGPVSAGVRSEALCAVLNLSAMTGEEADIVAIGREAIDLAEAAGDARREARALIALGSFGPHADAERVLRDAIVFSEAIGYAWATLTATLNLASLYAGDGRWSAALDAFRDAAGVAAATGDEEGRAFADAMQADLLAKLGRAEDALALAVAASDRYRVVWPQGAMRVSALSIRATCEVLTGRPTTALRTLADACAVARAAESDIAVAEVVEAGLHVLADRRPNLAARLGGFLAARDAAENPPRPAHPVTIAAVARVRRALGPRPFERLEREGRSVAGWTLLGEVESAVLELARSELQASAEFGSLTPREVEVLLLVGRGRTDGEIAEELGMRPKTASVHVANIKSKLGLDTRIEVALRARELSTVDGRSKHA
jgi:predicted ATPase/DNA-binding CsgD family transcriptional regulator